MPTYQYACRDCDHSFEAAQSFSDDSLTVCPSCQGRLRKVFNAVGVVFKGSGFYRTDSRSDAKAAAAKSDAGKSDSASTGSSESSTSSESSSGTAKSDSNGSGKSDSKPAAKPKTEAGAA